MFMRQELVEQHERGCAHQNGCADNKSGGPRAAPAQPLFLGRFQPGQDKRKGAGCKHYAGPKTQHGILNGLRQRDRKSTRLNSSHVASSYAVFCLKKKNMRKATTFSNINKQHAYHGGVVTTGVTISVAG